jgi:DNA-binding LacI/PurR family transcriptional regulator
MVSVNDVARHAGVSNATVSRVMNDPDAVTVQTRQRVRQAFEALGYRPNRVARRLRRKSGQRDLVGLMIPDIQNPFFADLARGVEDVAAAHGIAVILCNSNDEPAKERFYFDVMRAEAVDGAIVVPVTEDDPAVMAWTREGGVLVTVDRSVNLPAVDRVEIDNHRGAYEATHYLIASGHRRIGLITGRDNVSTSRDRQRGFEDALQAHRLRFPAEYLRVGDFRQLAGQTLATELLALPTPPTALLVLNNLMAVGALAAIHARNLQIPSDVAVIGFDELPWSEALNPPLTVVRQPARDAGRSAMELLLQRLKHPQRSRTRVLLLPELVVRKSC